MHYASLRTHKVTAVMICIIEVIAIFAKTCPEFVTSRYIISILESFTHGHISKIALTSSYLFYWFIAMASITFRVAAFRELGRMFTFELSIRKDHKLVTTGPYSVVRHPSYTGGCGFLFAYVMCQSSQGTWLHECGPLAGTVAGKWVFAGMVTFFCLFTIAFALRCSEEDRMMKKEFEQQWNEWATKVPSKMIPSIF